MLMIQTCIRHGRGAMSGYVGNDDSLMTQQELEEEKQWDAEFQRRQEDLARQELKSRERRRQVSAKMSELRERWEGVERRRQVRSRQGTASTSPQMAVTATPGLSHNSISRNSNNGTSR